MSIQKSQTNITSIAREEQHQVSAQVLEKVIAEGDLASLTPVQRVEYYKSTCASMGLNPLTRPFEYVRLNGKLTFYARKDCAEQLRSLKKISINKMEQKTSGEICVVTVYGTNSDGREDVSTGAVSIKGLHGDSLANAFMKAETKAKRRLTLSLAGLGMLDETEVASVKDAAVVRVDSVTGEIIEPQKIAPPKIEEDYVKFTPEEIIENIKNASTIQELIDSYVEGKRSPYIKSEEFRERMVHEKNKRRSELEEKQEGEF